MKYSDVFPDKKGTSIMSYCVHCGVELDQTCALCPLCHTPVQNPNQPVDTYGPKPFPSRKGVSEPIHHYEFTILISTILATVAVVCFILNCFVFSSTRWSVYVIGICALLWIFFLPFFFPETIHTSHSLILNGLGIAVFLWVISVLHPGNGWYLDIGLPITILGTLLVFVFYFFTLRQKSSFIMKTALFFGNLGLLCVAIELLWHLHYQHPVSLSWSAIVLTCCISIDVVLITLSFMKGLREEVRRRMHF